MASSASGGTDVEVLTDLAITGKPAQFGRGVMQDVSDKLLGQFVACLEQRLGDPAAADSAADRRPLPAPSAAPVDAPDGGRRPAAPDRRVPRRRPTPPRRAARHAPPGPGTGAAGQADDAIDLGSTVLPILVKTYWKQGLAVLVVAVTRLC